MALALLTGCNSGGNPVEDVSALKDTINKQEQKIRNLEKELADLRAQETKSMVAEEKPQGEGGMIIEKGQSILIDDYCEFIIVDTVFAKKILPPTPGSFYTYYEVKEVDTTYLDIIVDIKSLLTTGKTADEFATVKVIYNDKYEYSTFSTIEDGGGSDFTYTNITLIEPLKNGTLHFLAEVPESVASGTEPIKAIITIGKQEYKHNIR